MRFVSLDAAMAFTGHVSKNSFNNWLGRYEADFPAHPILRCGNRVDLDSIEAAIIRKAHARSAAKQGKREATK